MEHWGLRIRSKGRSIVSELGCISDETNLLRWRIAVIGSSGRSAAPERSSLFLSVVADGLRFFLSFSNGPMLSTNTPGSLHLAPAPPLAQGAASARTTDPRGGGHRVAAAARGTCGGRVGRWRLGREFARLWVGQGDWREGIEGRAKRMACWK